MNFEKLKATVDQVVEVVEKVPEAFKERAFEMLFQAAIRDASDGKVPTSGVHERNNGNAGQTEDSDEPVDELPDIKPRFKTFMRNNGLTSEQLRAVVEFDDEGNPHFMRVPSTDKKATAQAEWILLLALAEGLKTGVLSVKYDEIRSKCEGEGVLDPANFAKHLKGGKIKKMLLGTPESGGEAKRLSSLGETELAKLVERLAP